jgi:hypothetical protein
MKMSKQILLVVLLFIATIGAKAQTPTLSTSINDVTIAYLDIKNALAADDGVAAQAKAKLLVSKLNGVPSEGMNPGQQGTWRRYADKLMYDSRHISETTIIDHQREHFASLSKNVYAIIKIYGVNNSPIYWQYCPMKKMNWLSETQDIKNPYYGKTMLDCGSTKETLKVAK